MMWNIKWKMLMWLSVVVICLGACGKPKSLEYVDTTHISIEKLGLNKTAISADIKYFNPNNFNMKLKSAEMDISVNDNFLGHSSLDTLMEIPKLDTFYIPVHLEVDMKSLLTNSLTAFLSDEVNIKLEGKARLGKSGIFFTFPFTYQGKQKFNLFQ